MASDSATEWGAHTTLPAVDAPICRYRPLLNACRLEITAGRARAPPRYRRASARAMGDDDDGAELG
jgi:hypothetical protein